MTLGDGKGKKHAYRKIILDNRHNLFYKSSIFSHSRGVAREPSGHGEAMRLSVRVLTDGVNRGAGVSQLKGPDTTVRTRDRGSDPDGDRVLAGLQWPLQQFSTTLQASSGGVTDTSRPSMKAAREAP
jgi:hypothetical protein